jgi:tripartite-type tricarboxylate transporter receptor subunit TctC
VETDLDRRSFLRGTLALAASCVSPLALAADYPDKPIHVIVPFAPAGNVDTMARLVSAALTSRWGTSVIVENRPGAGGSIGADYVARSQPDGYTLLASSNGPLTVNPFFQRNMPYDPFKDLIPIGKISDVAHVFAVHTSVQANTLTELIQLSKRKPVNTGTSGVGSASHMTLVRFNFATGANLTHVPYRGGGALVADLVGGSLDAAITELSTAEPLHRAGKVRILAVASQHRSELMPDVPTAIEQGVTDFVATSYVGLLSPASTPANINARVQQALAASLATDDMAKKMRDLGAELASQPERTGDGFRAFLRGEYDRSQAAARQAGIQPE